MQCLANNMILMWERRKIHVTMYRCPGLSAKTVGEGISMFAKPIHILPKVL